MLMGKKTSRRWHAGILACIAAGLVILCSTACAASASAQMQKPTTRALSGTITDAGHEGIRNAVVQLRNDKTNEIVTYITDSTGKYHFKRLDGSTDYEVWVLFRGFHSKTRSISKFNSHMDTVINFTVRTY